MILYGARRPVSESTRTQLPFLASLEGQTDPGARRVLLRVATDLFVNDPAPSHDAIARYEEVATPLLRVSDSATRLIVSRKIAPRAATPSSVLNVIVALGGEACLVVLERAVAVDRALLTAAGCGLAAQASAVARRTDLDEPMTRLIAGHSAAAVVLTLARNLTAPMDEATFAKLVRRARDDKALAEALLQRPTAPLDRAGLFLFASSAQRAAMLLAAQRAELGRQPSSAWEPPQDAAPRLERHALARQPALFIAALADALGCEEADAERIVAEPTGEPLAVALAALGASEHATMRILLLGDAGRIDTKRLGALTRMKDALNPAAARRIIAALIGADRQERTTSQPVLDPTAAPTPSRATPTRKDLAKPDRRRAFSLAAGSEA
jgi:uncharacterized protein (DUF2336 family)